MKKPKSWLKIFFMLSGLLTLITLIWLILSPSLSENPFFLSFSLTRLSLILFVFLVMVSFFAGFFANEKSFAHKLVKEIFASKWVFILLVFLCLVSGYILVRYLTDGLGRFSQFFSRSLPLFLLFLGLSVEIIVFQRILIFFGVIPLHKFSVFRYFDPFIDNLLKMDVFHSQKISLYPSNIGSKAKRISCFLREGVFTFLCSLGVMLPIAPAFYQTASRDSGVFLYTGWRILQGAIPYADVWDHKPPFIFYLNALGLSFSNQSRWGVWAIELFFLFAAVFVAFKLLKKSFSLLPAIISLIVGMTSLGLMLQGGNYTTEYTLPMQFVSLWLFVSTFSDQSKKWRWVVIGLLGGLAFFTKQTAIGIWVSIIFVDLIIQLSKGKLNKWVHDLLFFLSGFLPVILGWVLYFASRNALEDFWSASFVFNFAYVGAFANKATRFEALRLAFEWFRNQGTMYFLVPGFIIGFLLVCSRNARKLNSHPLLLIGLIDLPLEFALIATSGKTMHHYFMTLLPSIIIFSATGFWAIQSLFTDKKHGKIFQSFVLSLILGLFLWNAIPKYYQQIIDYGKMNDGGVVDLIDEETSENDTVLLWGAESYLNFASRRLSPTKYVYQYPLYYENYADEAMILGFLSDVLVNQPELLIDCKNSEAPIFDFPIISLEINQKIERVKSQYQKTGQVGTWDIYKRIPD